MGLDTLQPHSRPACLMGRASLEEMYFEAKTSLSSSSETCRSRRLQVSQLAEAVARTRVHVPPA